MIIVRRCIYWKPGEVSNLEEFSVQLLRSTNVFLFTKPVQMLTTSQDDRPSVEPTLKLRTACENCRQSKVKCNVSGEGACVRCLRHGRQCRYGIANRSGKPKGSKNKATRRKLGELQMGMEPGPTPPAAERPTDNGTILFDHFVEITGHDVFCDSEKVGFWPPQSTGVQGLTTVFFIFRILPRRSKQCYIRVQGMVLVP